MTASPVARAATAALLDLVLVLVFVAIGRASHGEDLGPLGMAGTAGPFLVGWLAGWVLVGVAPATRQRPGRLLAGALVWAGVVVVGMLVRTAAGQGVQPSFVVVTAIVVGVFLLGWRGAAALVDRRRRTRRETPLTV